MLRQQREGPLPPLRERVDDIEDLARDFVRKFCEKYNRKILPFHPDAIARLEGHSWPGNVRELENVITRAMMACVGGELTAEDLPIQPDWDSASAEGYSYDCRWAVVARVQHLQHVHHRRNIFNGVLTLRAEQGRWKIAGVALFSEEREVVPWEPT